MRVPEDVSQTVSRWRWLTLLFLLLFTPTLYAACEVSEQRGDYAAALGCWQEAMVAGEGAPGVALYRRARAWRMLGYREVAAEELERLALVAEVSPAVTLAAELLSAQLALERGEREAVREQALGLRQQAAELRRYGLQADAEQLLGDLAALAGDAAAAARYYTEAYATATLAESPVAQVVALLARAQLAGEAGRSDSDQALVQIRQLPLGDLRSALIVRWVEQRRGAQTLAPGVAFVLLGEVIEGARAGGNLRLLSRASGILGAIYEEAERYGEALALTGEAIRVADPLRDGDLLLRWEWQQGRLQQALGESQAALQALRRASYHLDRIRFDLPVDYSAGRSSFRETLEPLYLDLVELLLTQAAEQQGAPRQRLLDEVQETMERLKTAELQDYFRDACAVTPSSLSALGVLHPRTAVLYPILLPQRLELLVQIGEQKHHYRVAAPRGQVTFLSTRLSRALRPTSQGVRGYSKRLAQQLYHLLIEPLEPLLAEQQIDTLIYLPDGPLRMVPLDALWDGERFLLERFAVVVAPGLTLLDPRPTPRRGLVGLIAGVSTPGAAVDQLPAGMRDTLAGWSAPLANDLPSTSSSLATTRQLTFRTLPDLHSDNPPLPAQEAALTSERARQALALPGVGEELRRIAEIFPVQQLHDSDFQLERFADEVSKSYRIVHIASHGYFSGSPEESFVMTHDRLLDMHRLEQLFRSEAFSDQPVEILTLSACQTAEGDERSPLGLSGVAIRSGARSALGSLWPVADEAAQILLPGFYAQLHQDEQQSKAKALQQAKLDLMQQPQFAHPTFWSAFILIGNWL